MKGIVFLLTVSLTVAVSAQPVFHNPGIPENESFTIHEYLNDETGYIFSQIQVTVDNKEHPAYYIIHANEGGLFTNDIKIRYDDLTTVSEKRTDLKTNSVTQYYVKSGDSVHFYVETKNLHRDIETDETNLYSPLAYFFTFRGFPFGTGKTVSFQTYMYQYGNVLTMNLKNTGVRTVTVKAGTYKCYVLELSVGGWQSFFAPDKYYFYFTVSPPHQFIKYEEKVDGTWRADELTSYESK